MKEHVDENKFVKLGLYSVSSLFNEIYRWNKGKQTGYKKQIIQKNTEGSCIKRFHNKIKETYKNTEKNNIEILNQIIKSHKKQLKRTRKWIN